MFKSYEHVLLHNMLLAQQTKLVYRSKMILNCILNTRLMRLIMFKMKKYHVIVIEIGRLLISSSFGKLIIMCTLTANLRKLFTFSKAIFFFISWFTDPPTQIFAFKKNIYMSHNL